MARDAKKHQQRVERRNKRAKEKRREYVKSRDATPLQLLRRAEAAPFLPCRIHEAAFTQGMGNLVVARELPDHSLVAVGFLLDLYCLGVKNIMFRHCPREEFDGYYLRQVFGGERPRILTPEEAKKLVEGAVAYAARYGFQPHEDYAKCTAVFDGVDSSSCTTEFAFGKSGKPFYISGPDDGPAVQKRIRDTLDKNAGPGNYDFLVLAGKGTSPEWDALQDAEWKDGEGGEDA